MSSKQPKDNKATFKHTFKTDNNTDTTESNLIVLKIGSSSINSPEGHILVSNLGRFVEYTHALRLKGYKVVIISSGAVSVGVNKLKLGSRPSSVVMKQAVASVGQNALMTMYDNLFSALGMTTAQILLTRDNINNEYHYLNATNTLEQLIAMDIVPIINENDTISISELKIGDNDSLSAMVACMLNAKHLFLSTDVSCLYTADPKSDPTAQPLHLVEDINGILDKFASSSTTSTPTTVQSGKWGTGGMATKITAANLCISCGVDASIISSMELNNMFSILSGDYTTGTTFKARHGQSSCLTGRKKFLWVGMSPVGELYIDKKCSHLFTRDLTRSYHLLPAGILYATPDITPGQCVNIVVADDEYLKTKFGKQYLKSKPFCDKNTPATSPAQSAPEGQNSTSDSESSNSGSFNLDVDTELKPGLVIGRGIVNFASDEIIKLRGVNTKQMDAALGYHAKHHSIIESDNLAIHYRPIDSALPYINNYPSTPTVE